MDTILMISGNSETSNPHNLQAFYLTLPIKEKWVALSNL